MRLLQLQMFSFLAFFVFVFPAQADISYTPVTHSELQAVYEDGTSYWTFLHPTTTRYPVSVVGIVINNPWDMLDYGSSASSPAWQTFIQAINPNDYGISYPNWSDFGGTALYMRRYSPRGPANHYTAEEWQSEMERVNRPLGLSEPSLRYGDVVLVQAKAPGMFFRGKYNINEQHYKSPDYDFSITILARGVTPSVATITLADLKDASNDFIFDATRQTGCEHYQASLVHLDNLLLLDPENWALDGTVHVTQVGFEGRTFDLKLGIDPALATINAAMLTTTPFSITAILDQEAYSGDNTEGYRFWLTNAQGLMAIPEPSGVLLLLMAGAAIVAGLAGKSLRRQR